MAAALAAVAPTLILAIRLVLEERVLRVRFPEYADYASEVRWRMLPGVW